MNRVALKFSYDGAAFDGYARQPTGRTVEGDIIQVLTSMMAIADAEGGRFQSASRTDKGVSAAGNVIAFDTNFDTKRLVKALNTGLEDIHFYGIAEVADDYKPRHARQRHYRYVLPADEVADPGLFKETLEMFAGEHDFRSFSKKDGEKDRTVLTIDEIAVTTDGDCILVDFKAKFFLWQLIRRLISTGCAVARGDITGSLVPKILSGDEPYQGSKPMPAKRLILMDVSYAFEFSLIRSECVVFRFASKDAGVRVKVMDQVHKAVKTS